MFWKRNKRRKQSVAMQDVISRQLDVLAETMSEIKGEIAHLKDRVEGVQTTQGRQGREVAKATMVFENRASLLNDALVEIKRQAQEADRAESERREAVHRAEVQGQLVAGLLPVLDGLWAAKLSAEDAARARAEVDSNQLAQGLATLHQRGEALLATWGINPINPVGKAFDPDLHKIVEIIDVSSGDAALFSGGSGVTVYDTGQWVISEWRRGYMQKSGVLRFSEVVVGRRTVEAG